MQTSAERVFPNLTPEEARSKYGELTLSQRIKLVPQEIKVMTGSNVSSDVVEDIINNPNKNKGKGGPLEVVENFVKDLVSGIFKPFGIDINKTPDIQTVVNNNENATEQGDITDDSIKITTDEEDETEIIYDTKGNAPFTDSKKPTGTIFSSPTRSPDLYQDQMFMGRAETPVAPTPTTLNTSPLRPYIDPIYDEIGRGTPTSKQRLEGIKETLKFLEKDASNLRNQNLNRTSKTVNKKRDDEARQRRRDKKRSFADAADKKTTKIIAKRGRRDQDKVDKADKDIKDRLKEASKTGTLRLKKGGLMKKNYP